MRRIALFITVILMLSAGLNAQNIAGDWQGTLKDNASGLRIVMHIEADGKGGWIAKQYSIDQQPDPIPVNSITLKNRTLMFSIDAVHGSYEGKLSADGKSIRGAWKQGDSTPLDLVRATKKTLWSKDASPHTVQFIAVDKDVKLEVLDWGGTGRPLVFLAGLGNTAHIFDKFAPKFTNKYHVYGITRRGFGESSSPAPTEKNYSSDRLGDDILAVDDALKLNRPVLVGHSIAGGELSSIAVRHPEKVSGLIYLEAGYVYAFYDSAHGNLIMDALDLRDTLTENTVDDLTRLEMMKTLLGKTQQLEKELQAQIKHVEGLPPLKPKDKPSVPTISDAIVSGGHKYTKIPIPCLAIFAVPHDFSGSGLDAKRQAEVEASDREAVGSQANAFEAGVPTAHVVRLAKAGHYVFLSNEADVLREMNAFLDSLH